MKDIKIKLFRENIGYINIIPPWLWSRQNYFSNRTQNKIEGGNKEEPLLIAFRSDIYLQVLMCRCVNLIWIPDLKFYSFRESMVNWLVGHPGQDGSPSQVTWAGSAWYTFLNFWVTLCDRQCSTISRKILPHEYFSIPAFKHFESSCFLPFFNTFILPNDTGIWDKVTVWKGHLITRSFRDDAVCIILSH